MPGSKKKRSTSLTLTWEEFSEILARHRRWIDSGGREGEKADFTGAQLSEWDFSGQYLNSVNFRDADLSKAIFQDANLEYADFRGADLGEADFTKSRHLMASQLAGADLSDCRLPEDLGEFTILPHVDATTRHAQTLFFTQLLVCVFCWLTIFVTTDPGLLANTIETPLPVINTKINIVMFYWAAPSLLFCLYLYFHLCLQRLWEAVANLPAYFPDGRPLPQRLHPWLLHGLIWAFFPRLRRDRPVLTWLQNLLNKFLAWWAVPLTLFFLWRRYLPAHEWVVTSIQIGLLTLAVTAAVAFSVFTRKTLGLKESRPFLLITAWRDLRLYQVGALFLMTGMIAVAFSIFSYYAFKGWFASEYRLFVKEEGEKEVRREPRKLTDKMSAVFWKVLAENSCANLAEAEVSTKPPNWTYKTPEDLKAVTGAKLRGRDLRYANGFKAFLVNAELIRADLQQANLEVAYLQGANLEYAKLQGAELSWAYLQGSNLYRASLQGARGIGARLQGATLKEAGLVEAQLSSAKMQEANLEKANARKVCLFHAMLNEAILKKAKLQEATLNGANLEGANLEEADLREAKIDANLQRAKLMYADLKGAKLSYANLQGAILTGANLQGANLEGANLQGADLTGSGGLTKDLLFLDTYQPAENSTYSENINSFWVGRFPSDAQAFLWLSCPSRPKFPPPKTALFARQIRSTIFAGPMITVGAGKIHCI
jgi:uncharacterized protein YjbI with pentapeptide repeats